MAYEIKGRLSVGQLFSLPRLTTAERVTLGATLAAVDNGSQVWDTDLNVVFTWNGSWEFASTVDWATITADPAPAVLDAKYVLDYAAASTFTLPATSGGGKEVNVLVIGENVTVGVQAGETLNGVTDDTRLLDSQYALWTFIDTSAGWIGQAVGSITQTLASLFVESAADVTIPASVAFQVFTFGTVVKDTAGGWTGTTYTIPNDGDYQFLSSMIWDNQSGVTNDLMNLQIRIDGIVTEEIIIDASANFGNDDPAEQTMHVILPNLTTGQVLDFGVANTQDIIDFNADSSVYITQLPTTVSIPAGSTLATPLSFYSNHRRYNSTASQTVPSTAIGYSTSAVVDLSLGVTDTSNDVSVASNIITINRAGTYKVTFIPNINDNGASDTRFTVYIGDGTNELIAQEYSVNSGFANQNTVEYVATFGASSTIDFRVQSDNSGQTGQLNGYSVSIVPIATVTALKPEDAIVQEWTAYTPTLHGGTTAPVRATTHNEKAYYRVIGKQLEIMYQYSHTATTGAAGGTGSYGWGLPTGFVVDTNTIETNDSNGLINTVVGSSQGHVSGVDQRTGNAFIQDVNGTLAVVINTIATVNTTQEIGSTWFSLTTANLGISFTARIPIL